ncbi:MAG: RDD family protein [Synergistaceae bacterium]|nr:RDD family protein [Synergistaceae bacterium]
MATRIDRAGELIEGMKRKRKELFTPEGVPLDIQIAGHGERLTAFIIDMVFMIAVIYGLYLILLMLLFSRTGLVSFKIGMTIILFIAFIVRNLYFLHFELAWQGRTPGKRICSLRVISRAGGELSPSAVVARNLTREVEIFLPLGLFLSIDAESAALGKVALLGWAAALTVLPLFNREHLRAGDLIGGTQVIALPKRVLLGDLTEQRMSHRTVALPKNYIFTHEQLAIYGNFELQVLEEILRRPANVENVNLLTVVCVKICRKIGWDEPVPPEDTRRFLNDFYAAERANLERSQLFGNVREDKSTALKR